MQKERIFWRSFFIAFICFFIGLLCCGYIFWMLPSISLKPETIEPACITGGWKFALITTHLLNFILIPITMKIFDLRSSYLVNKGLHSPFSIQLGLALIMVAIASEVGWHVTQCWYYQDQFTALNFMFYFFLISAFALWADGFLENKCVDFVFVSALAIVSILYPLGDKFNNPIFKLPIYVVLTLIFGFLVYRSYKVLQDWRIIFFPFFSVVVNLTFVFLLNKYGGNPYTNPQITYNALFHILHDLGGTEAGLAIFAYLVYRNPYRLQSSELKSSS